MAPHHGRIARGIAVAIDHAVARPPDAVIVAETEAGTCEPGCHIAGVVGIPPSAVIGLSSHAGRDNPCNRLAPVHRIDESLFQSLAR